MTGLAIFICGFMGLITSAQLDPITAHVERVIDGDTIQVRVDGTRYTIRLIGVDTPETKHPTKPVQYFGQEASAFTKAALEGKTVILQKDRDGDTVDPLRALASLRPAGRRQLQRAAHPRRLRSCFAGAFPSRSGRSLFNWKNKCQGRSKFGPLRRSKSRPVGEGVAVFVGRLERSLRSPFRAAQA